MATAYGLLGPLEAHVDGRPARLGGTRQRAVLAMLVLNAGQVVPADRLIDETWPEEPPDTAANVVQGHVSSLRKELGRDAIQTRDPGYLMRVDAGAIDVARFERLAAEGAALLREGRAEDARGALAQALGLWRGPALADLATAGVLRPVAARLDDLRLIALERRLEAELALGRHADVAVELEDLVAAHPLREGPHALRMLALYRCGRQADALAAYRAARQALVDELGLEPSAALQDLERAILRHDPALAAPATDAAAGPWRAAAGRGATRAAADDRRRRPRDRRARPPAGAGRTAGQRRGARDRRRDHRRRRLALPAAIGRCTTRARPPARSRARAVAAFTSLTPGSDLARLAAEQDASVVLVDAPDGLLEDARLLTLLADAPCDVAVVVGDGVPRGPVLVPFTGSPHDWAATELGAWFARATRTPRCCWPARSTGASGRDASRLLANASLAVQRGLGVATEPRARRARVRTACSRAAEEAGPRGRRPHRSLAPRGPRPRPHRARRRTRAADAARAARPAPGRPRSARTRTPASPGRSGRRALTVSARGGPGRRRRLPARQAGGRRRRRRREDAAEALLDVRHGADGAQHALAVLVRDAHERDVADALAVGVEPHVPVREVRLHAAPAPRGAVRRPAPSSPPVVSSASMSASIAS